ncbi:MAG: CoA pyrophosphatase [Gammaproteobacteria bacterium]
MPGLSAELTRRLAQMHGKFKPAAVLVPLVERSAGLTVLLTVRALDLPEHPGQISFPGGRVEPGDAGPSDTALRETEEEIGLQRHFVTIAGYLDNYPTITGYAVTPVVGFVRTGFTLVPDQVEVSNVFEVPLDYVLDPANHRRRQDVLSGAPVTYYEILYNERRIWGATAGMLVSLYQRLKIN